MESESDLTDLTTPSVSSTPKFQSPEPFDGDSGDGEDFYVKTKPKKRKCCRSFRLPHWCIYVGWMILMVGSIVASYLTFLLGFNFGTEKATEWVNSFVISIFQSIFLTQPVQIVGFAIFFALVIKRADVDGDIDPETANLVESRQLNSRDELRKADFLPPVPATTIDKSVKLFRRRARRRQGTYKALKSIIGYLTFLSILWLIAYTDRMPDTYLLTKAVDTTFVRGSLNNGFKLSNVKDMETFWAYANSTLLQGLFGVTWYNGDAVNETGYVADKNLKLVGNPRLLQFRVRRGSCRISKFARPLIRWCYSSYSDSKADVEKYREGWTPLLGVSNLSTNTPWMYQKNSVKATLYGKVGSYSKGGYVVQLDRNNVSLSTVRLHSLQRDLWIDRGTRAVVIQFTLYNANANLFSIVTLLVEFSPSGGAIPSFNIHTTRLYRYVSPFQFFIVGCEIAFLLYLMYYTIKEACTVIHEKFKYLYDVWNWLEAAVILLGWAAVGLYIGRYVNTRNVTGSISSNSSSNFLDFTLIAQLDIAYLSCWGLVVFLSFFKTLRLLQFNRRMLLLASTLSEARRDLAAFFFVFAIIFVAFGLMNSMLFGQDLVRFSTFVTTLQYQFEILLGKINLDDLKGSHPFLAPFVFGIYAMTTTVLVINLLVSAIDKSFAVVKTDNDRLKNKYEVIQYIKEMIGLETEDEEDTDNSNGKDDNITLTKVLSLRKQRKNIEICQAVTEKTEILLERMTMIQLKAIRADLRMLTSPEQ